MADMDEPRDKSQPAPGGAPPGERPIALRVKQTRRKWPYVLFGVVVVLPIALLTAWTEVALHWPYSAGNRAGFIQKFSQKGWVCKTYEGELSMVSVPGAVPEKFVFSVHDDSVAQQITKLMGSRVALAYQEHRGIPNSCFGDTKYFVVGVKPLP